MPVTSQAKSGVGSTQTIATKVMNDWNALAGTLPSINKELKKYKLELTKP